MFLLMYAVVVVFVIEMGKVIFEALTKEEDPNKVRIAAWKRSVGWDE